MPEIEDQIEEKAGFSARHLPWLLLAGMLFLGAVVAITSAIPTPKEAYGEGTYQAGQQIEEGEWSVYIPSDDVSAAALYSANDSSSSILDGGADNEIQISIHSGDVLNVYGKAVAYRIS